MMWNSVIRSTSVGPSLRLRTDMIHGVHTCKSIALEIAGESVYFSPVCHVDCDIADLAAGIQHPHDHSKVRRHDHLLPPRQNAAWWPPPSQIACSVCRHASEGPLRICCSARCAATIDALMSCSAYATHFQHTPGHTLGALAPMARCVSAARRTHAAEMHNWWQHVAGPKQAIVTENQTKPTLTLASHPGRKAATPTPPWLIVKTRQTSRKATDEPMAAMGAEVVSQRPKAAQY
jgi:hypothetical protein